MQLIYSLRDPRAYQPKACGNKGAYLAKAKAQGLPVPEGFVLSTKAYQTFLYDTGLSDTIAALLSQRELSTLRFEEMFDVSLSIRNLFLRLPKVGFLAQALQSGLDGLPDPPARLRLMVRSSSSSEDGARHSFAGLHESLGPLSRNRLYEAVVSVYASLFSDRSLFYRLEQGLNPHTSSMAVLVQVFAAGRVSGVCFSVNPQKHDEMVIEAARGTARGVVEGSSSLWRYHVSRKDKHCLREHSPLRTKSRRPLLSPDELNQISDLALACEKMLHRPADLEWTQGADGLILLQARPASARARPSETDKPWEEADKRPWYLSLQKSLPELESLQKRITQRILPEMAQAAALLAQADLDSLDDHSLADALCARIEANQHWRDVYWRELIPFAHAMRLFGIFYNDALKPDDPHAFIDLLSGETLTAVRRNLALGALAACLREDPSLLALAENRDDSLLRHPRFGPMLSAFQAEFGNLACDELSCQDELDFFLSVLVTQAAAEPKTPVSDPASAQDKAAAFLNSLPAGRKRLGKRLLILAKSSRTLRDDDNLVLAAVAKELERASLAARIRLESKGQHPPHGCPPGELAKALLNANYSFRPASQSTDAVQGKAQPPSRLNSHQGQGASPGLAEGPARVIRRFDDLRLVQSGEIMVVDSLSPEMTFVAPLLAGIVERRGGMLVHGAIIAREYGLPCVTGVAGATELFDDGEILLVDGYGGSVRRVPHPGT